ncbi:MAG: hypothetical protein RJA57_1955 [Bacteroidota bacterium]|jgi:hypothetical protein
MRRSGWVLLVGLAIAIRWATWYPDWVESSYSRGIYPVIAQVQRLLFGWIPFSVGDLFYGFLLLVILYKTGSLIRVLFRRRFTRAYFVTGLQQAIFFFLFVYVCFNALWGLNYNRRGIASQLALDIRPPTVAELDTLTARLQDRVNFYAGFVSEAQRDTFNRKRQLFQGAVEAYAVAEQRHPFLRYRKRSVKPSLFSYLGNYLGFQGYYNPFTGEGQVNTTVPRFLEPFVTTHEIAHQLGYAKENEANFVGYLACRLSPSYAFRYSVYYDMYHYALGELYQVDSNRVHAYRNTVHPQVRADEKEHRDFYRRYRNPVESLVMWGYGQFLKANNQPAGKRSYNEVVSWLVAYGKKYGLDAL